MSSKKNKIKTLEPSIDRLHMGILSVYVSLMLLALGIFATVIFEISSSIMTQKVGGLLAADSQQLEINIDNYLLQIEKTTSLLFADEKYCDFDATDENLDEYEKIQMETEIQNRIVDIGLMGNYADFTLIYADNTNVGWLSNVTGDLFPNGTMYDNFSACISNPKTNDGWSFGVGGAQDRMYYVKRINRNTILLASFYSKELDSLFKISDELEGLTVRLVSEDDTILYSSDRAEIGDKLEENISNIVGRRENSMMIQEGYLANVATCRNGWRVICSVPQKLMLKEIRRLRYDTVLLGLLVALIFVFIGLRLIGKFTRPVNGVVDELQQKAMLDQMSGLLNKTSFETTVAEKLTALDEKNAFIFCMIDVDNFKNINDRLGHDYGDEVIVRVSNLLRRKLGTEYVIGRVGGDEFAIYKEVSSKNKAKYLVDTELMEFMNDFSEDFAEEYQKCETSLSIGIVIAKGKDVDFDLVYQRADSALYKSKRNGKNTYTIYREGK